MRDIKNVENESRKNVPCTIWSAALFTQHGVSKERGLELGCLYALANGTSKCIIELAYAVPLQHANQYFISLFIY